MPNPLRLHVLLVSDLPSLVERITAALEQAARPFQLDVRQQPVEEHALHDLVLCPFPGANFARCVQLRQDNRIGPLLALVEDQGVAAAALGAGADAALPLDRLGELPDQPAALRRAAPNAPAITFDGIHDQDLLRAFPGFLYQLEPQSLRFTFVSERAQQILGYPQRDWLQDPEFLAQHLHPDDRAASVAHWRAAAQDRRDRQFEFRMLAADGRIVWFRTQVQVVVDHDRPLALRGAMVDISARKRGEQALIDSELRWQFAIEGAGDGVWDWDATTDKVQFSHRWKEMLGYADDEIGDGLEEWSSRVHPDDLPSVYAALQPHLDGRTPAYVSEHRLLTKDGSWKWILDRGRVLTRDAQGKPLRVIGTHCDITERKRGETRREQYVKVLEMLAQGAPLEATLDRLLRTFELPDEGMRCVVMRVDEDGKRLRSCPAPGIPADYLAAVDGTVIGAASCSCGTAAHRRERVVVADIATDPLWAGQRETALAHGLRACWSEPLFDAHRAVIGVLAVYYQRTGDPPADHRPWIATAAQTAALCLISERAERQRLSLENQLRHAQKLEAMGTLAGGIAHDFNNILAAILGNIELARLDVSRGGSGRTNLDEIAKATHRATQLVRQILTFSRRQHVERQPIALRPVLEDSVRLMRAMLPASVDLQLHIDEDAPDVLADPTQIQQVLMNLSTNSWQALEGKAGRISIELRRFEVDPEFVRRQANLSPGTHALIVVSDNGKGMDHATLERVFEPFFTTKPVGQGTGLGLSVVHGIVRSHDGAIAVESVLGLGTTFRIWLPATRTTERASPEPSPDLPHGKGKRVLYLDDEPQLAELGRRMLEALGYVPAMFVRPADALDALRREPGRFDAIVTDLNMPGMSGTEFVEAARRIRQDLPVVMSSGFMTETARRTAQELGIRQFITKPNTMADLGGSLHRVLAK